MIWQKTLKALFGLTSMFGVAELAAGQGYGLVTELVEPVLVL